MRIADAAIEATVGRASGPSGVPSSDGTDDPRHQSAAGASDGPFAARLLRAETHCTWAELCDLSGWLPRAERHREKAAREFDVLLAGTLPTSSVDEWTRRINAGLLDASIAPALLGAGRVQRRLGSAEPAAMWLQGALLVASAQDKPEMAAAALVELAETIPAGDQRAVDFLRSALDCLPGDQAHPVRTAALTRLAEAAWRTGQGDEAEQVLSRAESSAHATADVVGAAECLSLRGDAALAVSAWARAADAYVRFADLLIDAYPLYVAGRMAHRALAVIQLAMSDEGIENLAEAREAARQLAQCGQVGLSAQVDHLKELSSAGAQGDDAWSAQEDTDRMGDLCAALGRDLAEARALLRAGPTA